MKKLVIKWVFDGSKNWLRPQVKISTLCLREMKYYVNRIIGIKFYIKKKIKKIKKIIYYHS